MGLPENGQRMLVRFLIEESESEKRMHGKNRTTVPKRHIFTLTGDLQIFEENM